MSGYPPIGVGNVPVPDVTLNADNLLSKWGFDDGSAPDWWYDRYHVDYRMRLDSYQPPCEWQHVLRVLVDRYLLPKLPPTVVLTDWADGTSNHNPCRVDTVDGVRPDVRDPRLDRRQYWPETVVTVPAADVAAVIAEVSAAEALER